MTYTRSSALRTLGLAAGGLIAATRVSAACPLTPEAEVGPFFTDDAPRGYNRSDIRAGVDGRNVQRGIPLRLTVRVRDAERDCSGMSGVHVDVWHCNAAGIYSNEPSQNSAGESWLRGYQLTDERGAVSFTTIVPGWYRGRTTHIHLRVRSRYAMGAALDDQSNTTQLFFDQNLVDTLATAFAPYSLQGTNDTTNAGDRVFTEQTRGLMQLTLTGSPSNGYAASAGLDLPIT